MTGNKQILISYFEMKGDIWVKISGFPASIEFANGMRSIATANWNNWDNTWYCKAEHGAEVEALVKECFPKNLVALWGEELKARISPKETVNCSLKACLFNERQAEWLASAFPDIADICYPKAVYRFGGQGSVPAGEHKTFFCKKELFRIARTLLASNDINVSVKSLNAGKGYKPFVETLNALHSYVFFALKQEHEEGVYTMVVLYQDTKPRKYQVKLFTDALSEQKSDD